MEKEKEHCPQCNYILYRKHEGLVCRNHRCKLYFKLGMGWVLLNKTQEQIINQDLSKFMFSLVSNRKKWMELKKEILFEQNYTCQFCKSHSHLAVHHIIPNHEEPIFAFDKDNLILACKDCHDKLHLNDKYKFN